MPQAEHGLTVLPKRRRATVRRGPYIAAKEIVRVQQSQGDSDESPSVGLRNYIGWRVYLRGPFPQSGVMVPVAALLQSVRYHLGNNPKGPARINSKGAGAIKYIDLGANDVGFHAGSLTHQLMSAMEGRRRSGNFDVLLGSGWMLRQVYAPAAAIPHQLDREAWPLATAVHVPAVDAVPFRSEELHEIHVDVRADAFVNGFGDVERTNAH
jgi:hypothetical protein